MYLPEEVGRLVLLHCLAESAKLEYFGACAKVPYTSPPLSRAGREGLLRTCKVQPRPDPLLHEMKCDEIGAHGSNEVKYIVNDGDLIDVNKLGIGSTQAANSRKVAMIICCMQIPLNAPTLEMLQIIDDFCGSSPKRQR